jgi:hypothetical protein
MVTTCAHIWRWNQARRTSASDKLIGLKLFKLKLVGLKLVGFKLVGFKLE